MSTIQSEIDRIKTASNNIYNNISKYVLGGALVGSNIENYAQYITDDYLISLNKGFIVNPKKYCIRYCYDPTEWGDYPINVQLIIDPVGSWGGRDFEGTVYSFYNSKYIVCPYKCNFSEPVAIGNNSWKPLVITQIDLLTGETISETNPFDYSNGYTYTTNKYSCGSHYCIIIE